MRLFAIKTEPDPVSFGEQTTLRLRVVFQNREWRAIENMVLGGKRSNISRSPRDGAKYKN